MDEHSQSSVLKLDHTNLAAASLGVRLRDRFRPRRFRRFEMHGLWDSSGLNG